MSTAVPSSVITSAKQDYYSKQEKSKIFLKYVSKVPVFDKKNRPFIIEEGDSRSFINANLICNDLCQEEINKNHHKLILL